MNESLSVQVGGLVVKTAGDLTSYGIVFATIIKLLPPLAALISILWIGFQFYHSEPIRAWRTKQKDT